VQQDAEGQLLHTQPNSARVSPAVAAAVPPAAPRLLSITEDSAWSTLSWVVAGVGGAIGLALLGLAATSTARHQTLRWTEERRGRGTRRARRSGFALTRHRARSSWGGEQDGYASSDSDSAGNSTVSGGSRSSSSAARSRRRCTQRVVKDAQYEVTLQATLYPAAGVLLIVAGGGLWAATQQWGPQAARDRVLARAVQAAQEKQSAQSMQGGGATSAAPADALHERAVEAQSAQGPSPVPQTLAIAPQAHVSSVHRPPHSAMSTSEAPAQDAVMQALRATTAALEAMTQQAGRMHSAPAYSAAAPLGGAGSASGGGTQVQDEEECLSGDHQRHHTLQDDEGHSWHAEQALGDAQYSGGNTEGEGGYRQHPRPQRPPPTTPSVRRLRTSLQEVEGVYNVPEGGVGGPNPFLHSASDMYKAAVSSSSFGAGPRNGRPRRDLSGAHNGAAAPAPSAEVSNWGGALPFPDVRTVPYHTSRTTIEPDTSRRYITTSFAQTRPDAYTAHLRTSARNAPVMGHMIEDGPRTQLLGIVQQNP